MRERSGFTGDAVSLSAILLTAKAVVGALRELPLEWGAENAAVSAWGKSFPLYSMTQKKARYLPTNTVHGFKSKFGFNFRPLLFLPTELWRR